MFDKHTTFSILLRHHPRRLVQKGNNGSVHYICLSEESFKRITKYASIYDISNERAAEKAIEHWWDDVGKWSVRAAIKKGVTKARRKHEPVIVMSAPLLVQQPQMMAVAQ